MRGLTARAGRGVARSRSRALQWYQRAAVQGHVKAREYHDKLRGLPAAVDPDEEDTTPAPSAIPSEQADVAAPRAEPARVGAKAKKGKRKAGAPRTVKASARGRGLTMGAPDSARSARPPGCAFAQRRASAAGPLRRPHAPLAARSPKARRRSAMLDAPVPLPLPVGVRRRALRWSGRPARSALRRAACRPPSPPCPTA